MTNAIGYAANDASSPLAPFHFDRRDLRPNDVDIAITHCGVCHSDLHQARNDWGGSLYPLVPGHEIVGRVQAIGPDVTGFSIGDAVAVGCLVDSCQNCDRCAAREEQQCRKGATGTYNAKDRIDGSLTFGGYSSSIVVRQEFVLKVDERLDLSVAAPLLCAGITSYSPLKTWNAGPGTRVGVVGLGGLGHMAVKLAVGLGAHVTVLTTSPGKVADATALGAHAVVLSGDRDAMKKARNSLDLIIDTVPVAHDIAPYLPLMDIDATLVLVGAIDVMPPIHSGLLLSGRKRVTGSAIGGIRETQELLDFCAQKGIEPQCETIAIADINEAYERMERNDVKYRFVIDMSTLPAPSAN
ncbi:MAG: NAD(P)-dependent alcohol dehydrogenase [Acidimicrobiia bacterium]